MQRGHKHERDVRLTRRPHRQLLNEPFKHIAVVTAESNGTMGLQLCERTVQRFIHMLKILSYVSALKPFLSRKEITMHVRWAEKHKLRTTMQLPTFAFTNKSSFTVQHVKNRRCV